MAANRIPVREKDIQRSICDYLTLKGIFHWRNNTGAFAGVYKGKKRFVRFGQPGAPDIIGIKTYRPGSYDLGQFFAIEVKAPKGKQSDEQADFQKRVEEAGGIYCLARSLQDVIDCLGLK